MAEIFSVIADPTRRELLRVLRESGGEISVGDMVILLGLSQPTVSKHLRVLRDASLVTVREEGQHRYYRLDEAPLRAVDAWLEPFVAPSVPAPSEPIDTVVAQATAAPRSGSVGVPAPFRRAAENLPDANDVGATLGRAVAQAQSRILDPVKKRLAHRDPG